MKDVLVLVIVAFVLCFITVEIDRALKVEEKFDQSIINNYRKQEGMNTNIFVDRYKVRSDQLDLKDSNAIDAVEND